MARVALGRWHGLLVTALVILASAVVGRTLLAAFAPVLGALYGLTLVAVVYAAYAGGLRVGLASAVLGAAFAFDHYLRLEEVFPQLQDRLVLATSVAVLTLGIAGMVGVLSQRAWRALRVQRELADQLAQKNRDLEESNRALRQLNESLDAFSYVVSHDLKEPVRAINAYSEALAEEAANTTLHEEARDLLDRNVATSRRLAKLVEGLLEFSRAAQHRAEEAKPVTVREALEAGECLVRFADAVRERGARVEVVEGPPFVAALPVVCQVLGNLVLNAVRHHDGPAPHVRVTPRPSADDPAFVEVVVEDDGPGFPPAVAEQFRKLDPRRPSTIRGGFGLLITRRAVEQVGGTMWVERSTDLGGAAVHVTLPAARSVPA